MTVYVVGYVQGTFVAGIYSFEAWHTEADSPDEAAEKFVEDEIAPEAVRQGHFHTLGTAEELAASDETVRDRLIAAYSENDN